MQIVSLADDKFVYGAMALFHSIRANSGLKRPRFVLLTPGISATNTDILQSNFEDIEVISCADIITDQRLPLERIDSFKRPRLNKLSIFGLPEQKMPSLYLDADTVCVGSLKALAKFDHFSACLNVGNQQLPHTVESRPMFNSGMMLFRPTRSLLSSILEFCEHFEFTSAYADQLLLNMFFHGQEQGVSFLSQEYNLAISAKRGLPRGWNTFRPRASMLHYTSVKPWLTYPFKRRMKNAVLYREEQELWWRIFDDFRRSAGGFEYFPRPLR